MSTAEPLLILALIAPLAGVGVLRLSWARERRSAALNTLGWTLFFTGGWSGGLVAGAWGVAVSALSGMAGAGVALAWAAATAPAGRQRASTRRVGLIPESGEPLRIGGRLLTFALVAIAAAAVSVGLAVAVRGVAARAGLGSADTVALAFFSLPIAWMLIAFALLMQETRRRQFAVLGIASLPIVPALALELLA